ncbi:MAG: DUF4082 domain-containing protein [Kineosporiaceae bacterium]
MSARGAAAVGAAALTAAGALAAMGAEGSFTADTAAASSFAAQVLAAPVPTAAIVTCGSTGDSTVRLSWPAVPGAGGYTVSGHGQSAVVGIGTDPVTWQSSPVPAAAGDLTFAVTTTAGAWTSADAAVRVAGCPVPTVPAAPDPAGATLSGGDGIAVTWTPGPDGGSPVTSWTATATTPGGPARTCTATPPATGCGLTGLPPATYTVTVSAANAVGTGPPTAPLDVTVAASASAPDAPSGVTATVTGGDDLAVAWTPGAANGSPVTSYTATADPGGQHCAAPAATVACTVADVIPGVTYTVTVTATNSAGTSPPSSPPVGVTVPVAPPLDTLTGAAPVLAYGLRLLDSDYTGPLVRVRRTSDGTWTDIGPSPDGILDTTALMTFCASTTCRVTTWYDQADGAAHHATQPTDSRQPWLVTNGTLETDLGGRPTLRHDDNQGLLAPTVPLGTTAVTATAVARAGAWNDRIVSFTATGEADDWNSAGSAQLLAYLGAEVPGGGGAQRGDGSALDRSAAYALVADADTAHLHANDLRWAGAPGTALAATGTVGIGQNTNPADGVANLSGVVTEVVLLPRAVSEGERRSLAENQLAYLGFSSPPSEVVVGFSAQDLTVRWDTPLRPASSPLTGYTASVQPGGAACSPGGGPPFLCTFTATDPGRHHYVQVSADHTDGPRHVFVTVVPPVTGCPCGLFGDSYVPGGPGEHESTPVELGLRLVAERDGAITGVRYYAPAAHPGDTVSLWDTSGNRLATAAAPATPGPGWTTGTFATAVPVTAGTEYVASYLTPDGLYHATENGFVGPVVRGPLAAPAQAGVFRYGGGFPSDVYRASDYAVDVTFVPDP